LIELLDFDKERKKKSQFALTRRFNDFAIARFEHFELDRSWLLGRSNIVAVLLWDTNVLPHDRIDQ